MSLMDCSALAEAKRLTPSQLASTSHSTNAHTVPPGGRSLETKHRECNTY